MNSSEHRPPEPANKLDGLVDDNVSPLALPRRLTPLAREAVTPDLIGATVMAVARRRGSVYA
jgi:hypothetical protein